MATFDAAINFVLRNEGVYSNDPDDPGGETSYGISAAVATRHGYTPGKLTLEEATNIYRTDPDFWHPRLEDLRSQRIATKLLDLRVNMGPTAATKILQRSLSALGYLADVADGLLGPRTINATNAADPERLLRMITALQAAEYARQCSSTPTKLRFIYGWLTRAAARP